jgi:hypothetical protein
MTRMVATVKLEISAIPVVRTMMIMSRYSGFGDGLNGGGEHGNQSS